MATLEKIRSNGTLVLIIIGLGLFAFLVTDYVRGDNSEQIERNNAIIIGGDVVDVFEYQERIDEIKFIYQEQYDMQISDALMEQIQQQTIETIIRERLVKEATDKVGIVVSSKELFDLVGGENIHPIMQSLSMFVDPETGAFDRNRLLKFIHDINADPEPNMTEDQIRSIQTGKAFWLFWENMIKNSKLEEKYNALVSNALNANSLDAKFAFENNLTSADAMYVLKPYHSIADSTITVTDKEIEKEYAKKKEQFKQDESRDIVYISFPVRPGQADFDRVAEWINEIKEEFTTTDDVVDLVNTTSDTPYLNYSLPVNDVDPDFKEFAAAGKKDSLAGPMLANNMYKMARIVETSFSPDTINVRNIVVFEQDDAKTQALADSIANAIRGGADFAALAQKYSKAQNGQNGGEWGWVKEQTVDRDMIKPLFYGPANENIFVVKTIGNGTHIIEVLERGEPVEKVRLAVMSRIVNTSTDTYNQIYNTAREYIVENNTIDLFETAAQEKGYVVYPVPNLQENVSKLNNINDSRKIIRWVFEAETEKVSDVFECGNNEFVVVAITSVNKKGYRPMEKVKPQLTALIKIDKKAEIITNEFNEKLSQGTSIQQFANAISLPADTLKNINFSSTRTAIGFEPVLVANAPYMQENTVSAPLKGKNGVYVISPYQLTVSDMGYDEVQQKTQLNSTYQYIVSDGLINVLKEKKDVVVKYSNFY